MKKVKILKKPKKGKIDKTILPINTSKTKPKQKVQSKEAQNYFKFYDDIKNPNQIYDW